MGTQVNLRKMLDRKQWEMVSPLPATVGGSAAVLIGSSQFDGLQLLHESGSTPACWLYSAVEDGWMSIATSGVTSPNAPSGTYHPSGPTGTATAGGANTITTAQTLPGSVAGYTIRITGGTGAGQERVIASNTYGANSVITVTSNWTTNPDNTSTFLLLTGRFWYCNPGGTPAMRHYDVATGLWSAALSMTGVSGFGASLGSALTATPAWGNPIATGTATAGAGTTLTNSGKAWTTNQWANYQLRITDGTGVGQVRTIASNTSTAITVSSAWTTNPDATSVYVIEPNDDFLYLIGNNVVTMFRYSISGNSWSTLSPGVARTTAASAGATLAFIAVASAASWADENNIKNGRYLYSFAGGASTNLAVYDIAANSWNNLQANYLRAGANVANLNSHWTVDREFIYLSGYTSPGTPVFRFDAVKQCLDPLPFYVQVGGTIVLSSPTQRLCMGYYVDGATVIRYLYQIAVTTSSYLVTPHVRMMLF